MKTTQDLIDFFEAIPSERWMKHALSDDLTGYDPLKERNCAFGHLNKHLHGSFEYRLDENSIAGSWKLVRSLDINPSKLIRANNHGPDDAKTNVINFLKEKLKENDTIQSAV